MLCDQFADRGHEFDRNLNNRLGTLFVPRLVLGKGFVLGLVLVVLQDPSNPLLVPTFWKSALHCQKPPPHPAFVSGEGFAFQLVGGNHEHAFGLRIGNLNHAQVSSCARPPNRDPRTLMARAILSGPEQYLLRFLFRYPVPAQMPQTGFVIHIIPHVQRYFHISFVGSAVRTNRTLGTAITRPKRSARSILHALIQYKRARNRNAPLS